MLALPSEGGAKRQRGKEGLCREISIPAAFAANGALLVAKPTGRRQAQLLALLAGEEGLEPPTPGFGDRCSNQLSYTPTPRVLARTR
jgi:hypothetical protein